MKNFALILFISFLSMITFTNSKSSFKSRSLKNSVKQAQAISFQNEGFIKARDIAAYNDNVWICTAQSTFFKLNGLNTTVSGTPPTSCKRLATNKNGDLYVVTENKNLFLLRRISPNSHVWSTITNTVNVTDVAVGPNGEVAIVNDKGVIYEIKSDVIQADPLNKEKFGDNCKIAVTFEKELVVFLANESRDVFRVTAGSKARLFPTVLADDVAVGPNFNLYITSKAGVYRKRPNTNDLYLIKPDGIADSIDVGNRIWAIGYDGYPYSSVDNL